MCVGGGRGGGELATGRAMHSILPHMRSGPQGLCDWVCLLGWMLEVAKETTYSTHLFIPSTILFTILLHILQFPGCLTAQDYAYTEADS